MTPAKRPDYGAAKAAMDCDDSLFGEGGCDGWHHSQHGIARNN